LVNWITVTKIEMVKLEKALIVPINSEQSLQDWIKFPTTKTQHEQKLKTQQKEERNMNRSYSINRSYNLKIGRGTQHEQEEEQKLKTQQKHSMNRSYKLQDLRVLLRWWWWMIWCGVGGFWFGTGVEKESEKLKVIETEMWCY